MNFLEETGLTYFWNKIQNLFIKKSNVVDSFFPIGSIYCTINNVSPSTFLGGTWTLCCQGETIIGVDESDEDFATSNLSGGEKTHILVMDEMPSHNHGQATLSGWAANMGNQQSSTTSLSCSGICSARQVSQYSGYGYNTHNNGYDGFNVNATHTHTTIGSGTAHNNLQPYIVCYIWTRTA